MSIELYLLRWFYNYQAFKTYGDYLETRFLKDNSPEIHQIFTAISSFHAKYPEKGIDSTEELRVYFLTIFPQAAESGAYEVLFAQIGKITPEPEIAQDFIREHQKRSEAAKLAMLALRVADGSKDFQSLIEATSSLGELGQPIGAKNEFVEVNEEGGFPDGGLYWRLGCLNKSLGPLRTGDNGCFYARPEAGKTTLAISESTFMVRQTEGNIIYFNNEQPGELMYYRAVQAFLGIPAEVFFKYKKQAITKFRVQTEGRFLIYDSAHMHRRDVERICRTYNPALLVFDQLRKVKGFESDRSDLEIGEHFMWARELAKEYGPVMALAQAGGSAEGKKWLTMDDMDSVKTAAQAEADWLVGVGKSNQEGLESIRHLSISKNKLLGGKDVDPKQRHGKMECRINSEICRYEDV